MSILHFTDTDDSTSHWEAVCTHLRKDTRHVLQLVRIFEFRPTIGTVGQVLIVVLIHTIVDVVLRIEQVLQVVEADGIHADTPVLCSHRNGDVQECKNTKI